MSKLSGGIICFIAGLLVQPCTARAKQESSKMYAEGFRHEKTTAQIEIDCCKDRLAIIRLERTAGLQPSFDEESLREAIKNFQVIEQNAAEADVTSKMVPKSS